MVILLTNWILVTTLFIWNRNRELRLQNPENSVEVNLVSGKTIFLVTQMDL